MPLVSPASFGPIFLTSYISKHVEYIIRSSLLFFLESIYSLSLPHPGWSTLDQILFLSQSISESLNKPKPCSPTILTTTDFSKAFDFVLHPALLHKLTSVGLPPSFAHWTQSLLSDRHDCMILKSQKLLHWSLSRCSTRICSWPCTFLSIHQ